MLACASACYRSSLFPGTATTVMKQLMNSAPVKLNTRQDNNCKGVIMTDPSKEDGVILALIERFEKQRLPMLNELKEKTDNGELLSDTDIEFLETVMHDAQQSKTLIDRHPEWQSFCANVVHLYETITAKALDNEKAS